MTSPVSAIEAIEKATQLGIAYDDLLRKHEGPQSFLFAGDVKAIDDAYDAWVSATRAASRLLPELAALAHQAEALQRENAEKDARIAALEAVLIAVEDGAVILGANEVVSAAAMKQVRTVLAIPTGTSGEQS